MEHESGYIPPLMVVSHNYLDFGTIDPLAIEANPAEITLHIKNSGGGVLAGNIIPQMEWVSAHPQSFRIPAGQSSEHTISIIGEFPHSSTWKNYSYDSIIFINSNGGSVSIAGAYLSAPVMQQKKTSPLWLLIPLPVIIIAAFIFLIFEGMRLRSIETPTQISDIDILYTQAAKTAFVQFTHTAVANASIHGLSTPTRSLPIDMISQVTPTITETPEITFTPENTFTPLPTGRFQDPEQFIYDYYEYINNREYNSAWALLSDNFQDECCNVFGSDPYYTYINFWNTVESIEVLSAYLQEYNTNPVPVIVTLKYTYVEGDEVEDSRVFYLIADTELNTLLIDEVK